jgi:hypothetical protein
MTFTLAAYVFVLQAAAAPQAFTACLPQGVSLEEPAAEVPSQMPGPTSASTVGARLQNLGARCRKKKLVDAKGREVRFHRLVGCWGNPPADYLEQTARQAKELTALKKKYTVVEIPCGLADPRKGDDVS